ncbi:MAG: hypothetical protein U5J64_03240 [Halobacteriales archaeon]|nr:hypothetical protein [Halobacteriales archaeon]
MTSKHTAVLIVVLVALLVLSSGCLGGNGDGGIDGGDDGGGSGAEVSFTQDETNGVGVQVSDMGGYDAMWVEPGNVEGGFQINEESDVPSVYVQEGGQSQLGDVCFKESSDAECMYQGESLDNAPDPERFAEFDGSIEVYGMSGGEKTLIETR